MRALRRRAGAARRFDALLQMQVAARANLLSAFIPARRRIGYDRSRSKDLHGLFVNERIPDRPGIHVLDAIGSFCEPLGLHQDRVRWDLPVPDDGARLGARAMAADEARRRCWSRRVPATCCATGAAERYAAVADHAAAHGWRVVLCGGRSELERAHRRRDPRPRCASRRSTWSARTR